MRPAIFDWLQRAGNVAPAEMHRVFNCGIGMVLVVTSDAAPAVVARLAQMGETAMVIGAVERVARSRCARHRGRADLPLDATHGFAAGAGGDVADEAHRDPDFRPRLEHGGVARGDRATGGSTQPSPASSAIVPMRPASPSPASRRVATSVVDHRRFADRPAFERALAAAIDALDARSRGDGRVHARRVRGLRRRATRDG